MDINSDHGYIRAKSLYIGPGRSPGTDIAMALDGTQATHISPFHNTFTSSDMPVYRIRTVLSLSPYVWCHLCISLSCSIHCSGQDPASKNYGAWLSGIRRLKSKILPTESLENWGRSSDFLMGSFTFCVAINISLLTSFTEIKPPLHVVESDHFEFQTLFSVMHSFHCVTISFTKNHLYINHGNWWHYYFCLI